MDMNQEAIHYIEEQNFEKAAELLNQAITEHPSDPLAYINFGNLLLHMNDNKRAANFFNKALELDDRVATAYYGLGNLYYNEQSFNQAQENYQKAIELGLKDGDVYYMLGMSFRGLEQDLLALPHLLRATELNPDDSESLFQYGLALAETSYINEAKQAFECTLKREAEHADAHYNLGVIALYNEKAKKAIDHFEQALSIQPDHLLAANGKKQVLKALGE